MALENRVLKGSSRGEIQSSVFIMHITDEMDAFIMGPYVDSEPLDELLAAKEPTVEPLDWLAMQDEDENAILLRRIYSEAPWDIFFLVVERFKGRKDLLRESSKRFKACVDACVSCIGYLPNFNVHSSHYPTSLPECFKSMPRVKTLDVHSLHRLSSLENVPSSLTKVNLYTCLPISSLEPLNICRNLTVLWCGGCLHLESLAPLAHLCCLVSLDINKTRVSDLSPVSHHPLRLVYCGGTLVNDLTPLLGCLDLRVLWAVGANDLNAEKIEAFKSSHQGTCTIAWAREEPEVNL